MDETDRQLYGDRLILLPPDILLEKIRYRLFDDPALELGWRRQGSVFAEISVFGNARLVLLSDASETDVLVMRANSNGVLFQTLTRTRSVPSEVPWQPPQETEQRIDLSDITNITPDILPILDRMYQTFIWEKDTDHGHEMYERDRASDELIIAYEKYFREDPIPEQPVPDESIPQESLLEAIAQKVFSISFESGVRRFGHEEQLRPLVVADFRVKGTTATIQLGSGNGSWENKITMTVDDPKAPRIASARIQFSVSLDGVMTERKDVDLANPLEVTPDVTSTLHQVLAAFSWDKVNGSRLTYGKFMKAIQHMPPADLAEDYSSSGSSGFSNMPHLMEMEGLADLVEERHKAIGKQLDGAVLWMNQPYPFFEPGKTQYRYLMWQEMIDTVPHYVTCELLTTPEGLVHKISLSRALSMDCDAKMWITRLNCGILTYCFTTLY